MKTWPARLIVVVILAGTAPAWSQEKSSYPPPSEVRAAFRKLLERPMVPLDVRAESLPADRVEKELPQRLEGVTFASERLPNGNVERVPTLLLAPAADPAQPRRPAVLVLHGTGGNKEAQLSWMRDLARRGIIGVAIDARHHGARSGGAAGATAYNQAIIDAWRTKAGEYQPHPFYLDTVWDIWRTIDYLQTRSDVDPERIGMIGISMGGIQTWLAAAVDERVKVTVPAIAVQSFRWSLDNGQWQGRARTIDAAHKAAARDLGKSEVDAEVCRALWNKVIPGMLDSFDCPSMLRLFAGRSLLILNGDQDPNCPIGGAQVAFASARAAFREAGCDDRLRINVAAGVGHTVTTPQRTEALDWFGRWLTSP